ncbi:MAG: hypothetical protein DRO93_10035 [Candidatus Thorarchaeota archaeon]|nr:MAG: hypothetical protein DRO93_10035 [Candidatus Thorarchaeota archaeon]
MASSNQAWTPHPRNSPKYVATVNSARRYLRHRTLPTYISQLVPGPIGSETWSLAWAYVRRFDDLVDKYLLENDTALDFIEGEREVLDQCFAGRLTIPRRSPLRHRWLLQYFENQNRFYTEDVRYLIEGLYSSALDDLSRRGRVIDCRTMRDLLIKKSVYFFKLFFVLGRFKLGSIRDRIAYALGMAVGQADDLLDFVEDYQQGFVNATTEELEALGVIPNPTNGYFIRELFEHGYWELNKAQIRAAFERALRSIRYLKERYVRSFLTLLSGAFSAAIEKMPSLDTALPSFSVKIPRPTLSIPLPSNESLAYRIGHRIITAALCFPEVVERLVGRFLKVESQKRHSATQLTGRRYSLELLEKSEEQ